MKQQPTDTQLLDWLERQKDRTISRRCLFERTDISWSLRHAIGPDPYAYPTVRAAIAAARDKEQE